MCLLSSAKITGISEKLKPGENPLTSAEGKDIHIGIDVSHYQGNIDWAQVRNAGYTFAFVKATEGTRFKDSYFIKNMNNGKANGVLMGAYHFARPKTNSAASPKGLSGQPFSPFSIGPRFSESMIIKEFRQVLLFAFSILVHKRLKVQLLAN